MMHPAKKGINLEREEGTLGQIDVCGTARPLTRCRWLLADLIHRVGSPAAFKVAQTSPEAVNVSQ